MGGLVRSAWNLCTFVPGDGGPLAVGEEEHKDCRFSDEMIL